MGKFALIELFDVYVHVIVMIWTLLVVVVIFNILLILTCLNSVDMHGVQPTDNLPASFFVFPIINQRNKKKR